MNAARRGRSAHDYDESDVHIRPGKPSRPRTKRRPAHADALFGTVVSKDRGRWGVVLDRDTELVTPGSAEAPPGIPAVTCMRAREMGRTAIEVGDRVGVVGDTSRRPGTLARIVKLAERTSVLRRTADDTDPYERIVAANADLLLIVSAVADPPPRTGFVERSLIAAYAGNVQPVICLTKSDLADPQPFAKEFSALRVPVLCCGMADNLEELHALIDGRVSALVGHSGVGKSTLVNRLVTGARRATGGLTEQGKGRHTSTQSVALPLPVADGGWIIDTPGIRSLGLAHVSPDDVLGVFDDLVSAAQDCPRGCGHLGAPADPECALDGLSGASGRRAQAVRSLLAALRTNVEWE